MSETALKYCDMHSHILPGIDDGCQNPEESLAVLRTCHETGVDRIFATPHYYGYSHPTRFAAARDHAFRKLSAVNDIPVEIKVGAEAAYFPGMATMDIDNFRILSMGASDYLLLELPFGRWDAMVIKDVEKMVRERNVKIILAHLERFIPLQKRKHVDELVNLPVLVQVNAESLIEEKLRKRILKFLPMDRIDLLGSDTHNTTTRRQRLRECCDALSAAGHEKAVVRMTALADAIFDQA